MCSVTVPHTLARARMPLYLVVSRQARPGVLHWPVRAHSVGSSQAELPLWGFRRLLFRAA
eukprot:2041445-Pyramimonas_sp.AAC.1